MTTAESITIERLAQTTKLEPGTVEKLRDAWREFQHALETEDHVGVMTYEDDVSFHLRGAALSLAQAALNAGDAELTETLTEWCKSGVPRAERETFVDILLTTPPK